MVVQEPETTAMQLYDLCENYGQGKQGMLRFTNKLLGLLTAGLTGTPKPAAPSPFAAGVPEPVRSRSQRFESSSAGRYQQQDKHSSEQEAVPLVGAGGSAMSAMVPSKPLGGVRYELKRFPYTGPRSVGRGIVNWLGMNFGTSKWSNPAIPQKHRKPLLSVARSSDAKGSAADAAGIVFTNSCTKSSPSIDDDGQPSNWYIFDFKGLLLLPTHYTLRHGWKPGKFCLLNWKLEGSATGKKGSWLALCQHTDDHSLAASPANSNTWVLTHGPQNYPWVRFLRVAMTGPNGHGSYTMCLSGFEVYGVCVHICQ